MQKTTFSYPLAARLPRRLSRVGVSAAPVAPESVSERIGSLLDLTASVSLSKALGGLDGLGFDANPTTSGQTTSDQTASDVIKKAVVEEHARLASHIVARFRPQAGSSRNKLPTLTEFHANCMDRDSFSIPMEPDTPNCSAAFSPYRKTYLATQGKLDIACHRLRLNTARAVARLSPDMNRIASLDNTLGNIFYHGQQQSFSRIPILLETHFGHLLSGQWKTLSRKNPEADDLAPWFAPGGWVILFCERMRDLLLAELELRLQPVLGLVESTDRSNING